MVSKTRKAWIHLHRLAKPNGAAAIICPGGGYGGLVMGAEGHGIAQWLNSHGITGVVLQYRLPKGRSFVPLEIQRAIRLVRHRAKEWKINANKVGDSWLFRWRALASTAATHFPKSGGPPAKNLFDRISLPSIRHFGLPGRHHGQANHRGSKHNLLGNNPDLQMVDLFSNEKQVTKETPPVFMAHAVDDRPVSRKTAGELYAALQIIPSKYMELPDGVTD